MEMLEKAVTWKPVICPPGKNIVGCKWVFRIKHKANGSIEKYKVQLIAHGFTHRVDYFETYSPIAKLASFCLILAIAAHHGWEVHMFDFNGMYLNGEQEGDCCARLSVAVLYHVLVVNSVFFVLGIKSVRSLGCLLYSLYLLGEDLVH